MRQIGCIAFFWMLTVQTAMAQTFQPVSFDALQGWQQPQEGALQAFRLSCQRGMKPGALAGRMDVGAWQHVCDLAKESTSESRRFFETHFQPYHVHSDEASKLTGYYIPLLDASLTRGGEYQWPIYRVPNDFAQPYLARAEIESGVLAGRGLEIAWLKDPVMRFFLHVQGSGHIQLPDGRIMTLQFAAKNGLPYTSIGKVLIEQGHLLKENVSLQSIRDHLRAHPDQRDAVFNQNESFIFFELKENDDMPKGAQAVPLTPMHSLAIDPAYWPYGLPVYLQPIGTLTITQDTGSAIKGLRRGDLFVGLGEEAEALAGHLNSSQDWIILLPKR